MGIIKGLLGGSEARDGQKGEAKINILDFIISASIGLVLFLIPLFFTGLSSQGLGFDKMILFYFLTLIGVVAWATKGVLTGELSLKRTPLDIPILAILIVYVISAVLSVSQKDSLIGSYGNSARSAAALFIFVLFYYLVVNNIDGLRIKRWFWAIVSAGSLLSIFSLLQLSKIFIIPAGFTHTIGFNLIGSSSSLTIFLVAFLPIVSMAITHIKEIHPTISDKAAWFVKIILGISVLADLAVLMLLNGFTFWPVAIVSVVIVLMFMLSKVIKTANNGLIVPIIIFFALIFLMVMKNFNFAKLDLPVEVSLSRKASWDITLSSLKTNPIFGSGPSTFYYDFSKFRNPALNSSQLWDVRFDNSSVSIFEFITNVGVLGALITIVIVLIALSIIFMAAIKTEKNEEQPVLLGLFSSFTAFIIFSLLFPFNNSLILISLVISVFSISTAIEIYPEKFNTLNLSFRASANYALALAAIFLSVSAGVVVLFIMGLKMFMADVYVNQAIAAQDVNSKVAKLNQAIALNPYEDAYYLELSKGYLAMANNEAQTGKDQTVVANYLNLAIENGKKAAVEINPNSANNNESLALVYENASFYTQGALQLAEDLYNKQMSLEPTNPVPYLRLALINMAKANLETKDEDKKTLIENAIKKYDEALAKKNDFSSAYYGKAVAYEKLNNIDGAIEELKKAVMTANTNLDYRFELARLLFNRGVIQPSIAQTASTDIATGSAEGEQLSVQPSAPTGATIKRNDDLNSAEQIFQNIVSVVPNNANSLYSLALLYQKTGELENARINVKKLLEILQDESQKELVKKQFPGLY